MASFPLWVSFYHIQPGTMIHIEQFFKDLVQLVNLVLQVRNLLFQDLVLQLEALGNALRFQVHFGDAPLPSHFQFIVLCHHVDLVL